MSTTQQWGRWEEEKPPSKLSDAELGDTLFSTAQGRWLIIAMMLGAMLFVVAWVKVPHVLAAAFAPTAALVGLYLYRYHPTLYVSFNWWVWILTCFARRLIEIKSGFMSTSPILLAPFLVTLPTVFTLLLHTRLLMRRHLIPFALILASLIYAYIVGIVSTGMAAASYGLLVWITPLLLGFHFAMQWEIYPAIRAVMRRTIISTVLVMGVYGIYQFFRPPSWDVFWVYSSKLSVVGLPLPMQMRIFSTMNSPAPFAVVLMASVIVLLSQQGKIGWLSLSIGATALMFTSVRTAWLSVVIGFLIYAWYVPWRSISRIIVPLVSLAALVGFVVTFTPAGDVLAKRFDTFSSLADDHSLHERMDFYSEISNRVLNEPLGEGMGGTGPAALMSQGTAIRNFDTGVLDIVFSLGWFGGLVYVIGLVGLGMFAMKVRAVRGDYFDLGLRAAALATLSILPSFNSLVGVDGIVFWGFLGLSIARCFWIQNWEEEEDHRARVMALEAAALEEAGAA